MKGAQRGGREGERYRGMEHKLSWKKRVQGLTNGCDWLAHWKDGGKSPARIITTRPVCQISAVICIRLLSIKWEPSDHQKGIFLWLGKYFPGAQYREMSARNVSELQEATILKEIVYVNLCLRYERWHTSCSRIWYNQTGNWLSDFGCLPCKWCEMIQYVITSDAWPSFST